MHIEPGIVEGGKLLLGYATAAGAALFTLKSVRNDLSARGSVSLLLRGGIATGVVLALFELLPHPAVGVSEVHLILGSTLFLVLGLAPAALGLAAGLLVQGLFFAPFDLPQYGMNMTTLLVPLFAVAALSPRLISPNTAYVDLSYRQVLSLSATYQAGIVSWVAFWSLYGQGFSVETLQSVATFGGAYLSVILIEPLVDLSILAVAKQARQTAASTLFERRLWASA